MNTTTPTSTPDPVARIAKRVAITIGAATVLIGLAGRAKKRHIVRRFDGKTAAEAHATILEYATRRTGDETKAAHIADRVVERLQARGVLADEANGTAA